MCYSTTKGTVRKSMAFPGVVKPSPWPGLQASSQFHPAMAGPLWSHHHHHNGVAASNHLREKIHSTSATTHFRVLPQARLPQPVTTAKDLLESPTATSTVNQPTLPEPPSSLHFEEEPVVQPVQTSSESALVPSSIKTSPQISNPPPASASGGGVRINTNGSTNEEPAVLNRNSTLSPTSIAKKKRTRRKRCGSCVGCTRKDNCGVCSVCTNMNATNSVCKLKRCEVLKRRVSFFTVRCSFLIQHSL